MSSPLILCLLAALLPGLVRPAPMEPSWNYSDQGSWSQEFPQCGGVGDQTPITLQPAVQSSTDDDNLPQLLSVQSGLKDGSLTASNTGRTLKVTLKDKFGDPAFQLESNSSTPLNGRYILDNLHLHWNDPAGGRGSEHKMNGTFEQAEAHFVFFNQQYGNVSAALAHADGLAVVGLLLRPDPALCLSLPTLGLDGDLPQLSQLGSSVTRQVDLRPLRKVLRTALKSFFSYQGSLTTPPCSPVVTWIVHDQPVSVEATFLQDLRTSLFSDVTGTNTLQNNWRFLQALGNRTIYRYHEL
ncbi:Carbonic anhydrase 2 [Amphibalanus amphitrite]|uniref:carbonic anhydrase n=1 Tax=Amphibalanus amphitrite TaxID=1232801 RepID=A0A6A4WNT3_AMPAM|nr:carbonic anhydrase 2-like [Amphibalanus amphitrite]KAF0303611.1 Carbonic anhydrase 2 [Amphibalanus amphitrite]